MNANTTTIQPHKLSAAQLRSFERDGFTSVPRLIDDDTVEILRDYYDRIVRGEIKCGDDDRHLGGLTRQVLNPRNHVDYFRNNPATRAGAEIAAQALGAPSHLEFDMLIYKPPGHPKATPWHQDLSYYRMPFAEPGLMIEAEALQFWVALDDVDASNGAMHFLPGRHRAGLEPHYVYSGDPADESRLLATKAFGDPDQPNAGIVCPLKAGGCTIHFHATPHYTSPNVTKDRGRRAYIFTMRV